MNKKLKLAIFFAALTASLSVVAVNRLRAETEDGDASKQVKSNTICCQNHKDVGSSNDCDRGQTTCVDGSCPTGTTEESPYCP